MNESFFCSKKKKVGEQQRPSDRGESDVAMLMFRPFERKKTTRRGSKRYVGHRAELGPRERGGQEEGLGQKCSTRPAANLLDFPNLRIEKR